MSKLKLNKSLGAFLIYVSLTLFYMGIHDGRGELIVGGNISNVVGCLLFFQKESK